MASQGGTLKSTSINGVKVYSLTGQNQSLATWLNPKKLRSLRKDKDYMQRVELIQDLRFETATTRIKATPDGEYVIASGIYPPQIKVYELRELALKFERHLVSEIVNFEVLSDDYSKIAFLCADRSVCLHAKYGSHYNLRIPRMGRDMAYDYWSCDLLCAASSPDLYRINLEQGRFLSPLNTQSPSLNVVSRSKSHGLVACGGEDGFIECFDMRANSSVARLDAVAPVGDVDQEITAIEFDGDGGYLMGVGSSVGKVLIYDLRSSHPIRVKDHMYGSPILNIKWHKTLNSEGTKLVTTDKHVVRIWDPETGEGMTSIEPTAGRINDICIFSGSGLILLALDSSQIPAYFIPAIGPAPKWCSYLDNLTEELEENAEITIYDDYKFLTKEELVKLNLTNLIGTNLLRAYMHGFFIDYRLYKKAKDSADPFAYEDYLERKKQDKMEKDRETRITVRRKLPKVNRALAAQILENEEAEKEKNEAEVVEKEKDEVEAADAKKTSKKRKGLTSEVMKDERFLQMFENQEFEINQSSQEFLALHPMSKKPSLIEEHFEPIPEYDDVDARDTDASTASQSSEDEHAIGKTRVPRLYEVKDERHADAFGNNVSLAKEDSLSLAERASSLRNARPVTRNVKFGKGGSREITFMKRSSAKYRDDDQDKEAPNHKRRGIQSLKLKQDGPNFRGRGGGGYRGRGGSRGRGRGRGGRR